MDDTASNAADDVPSSTPATAFTTASATAAGRSIVPAGSATSIVAAGTARGGASGTVPAVASPADIAATGAASALLVSAASGDDSRKPAGGGVVSTPRGTSVPEVVAVTVRAVRRSEARRARASASGNDALDSEVVSSPCAIALGAGREATLTAGASSKRTPFTGGPRDGG